MSNLITLTFKHYIRRSFATVRQKRQLHLALLRADYSRRVENDIHVLACYRVVLFQRPPDLYVGSATLSSAGLKPPSTTSELHDRDLLQTLASLMTPDGPTIRFKDNSDSAYTLAIILAYSWHSVQIRPSSHHEGLWKRSYFELALNRWLKSHNDPANDTTLLLFHLGMIVLHSNMASLHGLVRSFLQPSEQSSTVIEAIQSWRNSHHWRVATLHATHLMRAAKRVTMPLRSKGGFLSSSSSARTLKTAETPHTAICVYLAVLTLWAAEISVDEPNLDGARETLERGYNTLSHFNARIANILAVSLRRLEEKME